MGKEVAVVEDTIPLHHVPKEVCLSNGFIWDETQKLCVIKVRRFEDGRVLIVRGDGV